MPSPIYQIFKAHSSYHQVLPLELADTGKTATSIFNAFSKDPLTKYLSADEKLSPTLTKTINRICLMQWRRTKVVLTVDAGAAVVVATPPEFPISPIDKFSDFLLFCFISTLRRMLSREGRKRVKEATNKIKEVVDETIGDRIQAMLYVNLLATDPQSQGLGYGGALLEAIIHLADMNGQAVWLESSNVNNTDFYVSHGFKSVGQAFLGEDNPNWHDKPVIVPIMVREPRKGFNVQNTPGRKHDQKGFDRSVTVIESSIIHSHSGPLYP